MEIETSRADGVVVMRLKVGEGGRGKIDGVQKLVQELLEAGERRFVVDLSGCQWVDSSGLGELVRSLATVMRQGGSLKLSGATPRLRTILEVTNLTSVLDLYDDESAAIASFS